jgi:hypothetical protein
MKKLYSEKDELFWQKLLLPEEDRPHYAEWCGGYRWFRSSNVVCLEHYRVIKESHSDVAAAVGQT